jgi:DUF4097 and DUF4098 domain-containing protein YvlB
MKKLIFIVVTLSVMFLASATLFAAEGSFDKTLSVSGPVTLDLTTGSGDVTVRAGGSNQVVIHGRVHSSYGNWFGMGGSSESAIKAVQSNPPIEQNGNNIRIGYNLPEEAKNHVAISYEVTVPPDTSFQGHSGSGNLTIEGVRKSVTVTTGSGDIRLRDVAGTTSARTGSGSIRGQDIALPFTAHTGSGGIEADLTGSGDANVETGSGSVRLHGVKGGLRARTGSGDVSVDGGVGGSWNLHTGSGSVRMALGSSQGFNLNAHTGSGSIHSDLPITVQGSFRRNELRGAVRGGGPDVEVSTGSGDIEIR